MKHLRTVEDVMTHAVISVDRGTAFKDIGTEIGELIMYQLLPHVPAEAHVHAHGPVEVHVHVASGIAHLNGSLPDPAMEDIVVRAAGTVRGVVDVKADFTAPVSA
ncbi:hypothetical protein [Streptomyces sp. NPDC059761]|uniref:hypothetical protein n=1 Tax=Streptomyces sp. NPDC059761 TaxID=3346937 RepID=UPI00366426F0